MTFHLMTVASDKEKAHRLIESCERNGLNLKVINKQPWTGYVDKIRAMKEALEGIPDEDIVCFVDAYDVLCFAGEKEILEKFHSYGCRVLLSAELNCYPAENKEVYDYVYQEQGNRRLSNTSKDTQFNKRLNYSIPGCDDGNFYMDQVKREGVIEGTVGSLYKYVNSGGYIGFKADVEKMLNWKPIEEIEHICVLGGDQNYFTQYFLENVLGSNGQLKLDDRQLIFQSMYKIRFPEFSMVYGRLFNNVLGTFPCFAHFNGLNYFDYRVNESDGNVKHIMHVMSRV